MTRKVRMRLSAGLLSLMLAVAGLIGANAATAAASGPTYLYPVYHYQVCQRQGHFGASFWNNWNAYSWYCYDLSFPAGITSTTRTTINLGDLELMEQVINIIYVLLPFLVWSVAIALLAALGWGIIHYVKKRRR